MAWYNAGTVAVSATKVTGVGTNFLDPKFGVGEGQAFLIPGSGTVKMYEIASVEDATHLTLRTTAGVVAAGAAYAVMSFYTDSVPAFAARLAAQLGYYQSQMNGWQTIMTGTGTIAITAPDGTVVNISSFSKLTADMANAVQSKGRPSAAGYADVNSIGTVGNGLGIWSLDNATNYGLLNVPEASPGFLEVFSSGSYNGSQRYTTRTGHVYNRTLTAAWSAGSPDVWGAWIPLIATGDYGVGGLANYVTDLSSMFNGGWYYANTAVSQAAGLPARGHSIQVIPSASNGFTVQQAYPSTAVAGIQNKIYIRSFASGAWSTWFEALTVTSGGALPVANGGTGASTVAGAVAALGGFGSNAGNFAQGNDGRMNTINGKTGGAISSNVSIDGTTLDLRSNTPTGGWPFLLRFLAGQGNNIPYVQINQEQAGNLTVGTGLSGTAKYFSFLANGNMQAPGNITCVSLTQTSDVDKKDIKGRIESPLEKINALDGVTFNWKDTGMPSAGIIAQQLMEVLPECVGSVFDTRDEYGDVEEDVEVEEEVEGEIVKVTKKQMVTRLIKKRDDSKRTYSVEYSGVVALLLEGIKELSAKVSAMEAYIGPDKLAAMSKTETE